MSIEFKPYSDFLTVTGMKGYGKTVATKHLCRPLDYLLFIDPTWQCGELGYVVHDPDKVKEAMTRFRKVIYQPMHQNVIDYKKVFQVALSCSNFTLGIDEVNKFATGRWYMCEEYQDITNRGRAQGIGQIVNTRRPALIHLDVRSNSNFVLTFCLNERNDVEYMGDWIGIDKERIRNLKPYHSLLYNVEKKTVEELEPIRI